jgi:Secretion system C-terminal sorting domain
MKLFIILFSLYPLSISAQSGDEYDANEYDCTEYEALCAPVNTHSRAYLLFPNPATDIISITGLESDDTEGAIFDAAGRFFKRVQLVGDIDVRDLSDGFYLIRTKKRVFKFIKSE